MTTALSAAEVPRWVNRLREFRQMDAERLDEVYWYLRDPDIVESQHTLTGQAKGPLRWLNTGVPADVKRLAEMSRVNMLKFVVDATVQVMYVDGFRSPTGKGEEPAWETWQKNRMDARQIGVHRSALSYGSSYVVVLPGTDGAVLRGASPRKLTAVYGDDDDWPELALEKRRSPKKDTKLYRLYDAERTWWVEWVDERNVTVIKEESHDRGHVPIVRFLSSIDDDGQIVGDVAPLIPLQDQINVTTFGLLVAQHYGAFRQRYILGWTAETEQKALDASAKKLWTFEDDNIKVGEFSQTDLTGYINSREASLRHLATVSQTPAHELLGQLVNLSAEALTAAEASHRRKVLERQTTFGESWEQVLEESAAVQGEESDPMASVRWKDTEARSMSQMADALGKLALSLGVPPQELWEKIPGVSQAEVERWKAAAEKAGAVEQLTAVLTAQAQPPVPPGQAPPAPPVA